MTIGQVISLIKAFGGSGGGGSSGGGVLAATVTWNEDGTKATLSATYNQLLAAQLCVARDEHSNEYDYSITYMPLISLYGEEGVYGASFYNYVGRTSINFEANSPDSVLTYEESQGAPSD